MRRTEISEVPGETGHRYVGSHSQCASCYCERDVLRLAEDFTQHDDLRSPRLLLRPARRKGAFAGAERRRGFAFRRKPGRRDSRRAGTVRRKWFSPGRCHHYQSSARGRSTPEQYIDIHTVLRGRVVIRIRRDPRPLDGCRRSQYRLRSLQRYRPVDGRPAT